LSYVGLNGGEGKGENEHVIRLPELVMHWAASLEPNTRQQYLERCFLTSDIFIVYKENFSAGKDFDSFVSSSSLVGTCVGEYARLIGELEKEG
jgi:hypothetical protein